ncbi:MAG: hypothetical protein AB1452_14050 [Pseudomonadota bacterium]
MPISEDDVKKAMATWLKLRGFKNVKTRPGRTPGFDVEGVRSRSDKKLVVECKGETNAPNQWDRAWRNVSHGLFNAIKRTEDRANLYEVAVALPDTENYRRRMEGLKTFCGRQSIAIYWVAKDGSVRRW